MELDNEGLNNIKEISKKSAEDFGFKVSFPQGIKEIKQYFKEHNPSFNGKPITKMKDLKNIIFTGIKSLNKSIKGEFGNKKKPLLIVNIGAKFLEIRTKPVDGKTFSFNIGNQMDTIIVNE